MKLIAYVLNGNILGVDKTSWTDIEFNGIPFSAITDNSIIPTGYTDISSILNWGNFGESTGLGFNEIRNEIRKLRPKNISTLSENEIIILNNYGLNKYYLIYDSALSYIEGIINATAVPFNLDYDIIGLHKKKYFNKGELYKVEYYINFNSLTNQYFDLCVSEDRIYYRHNGMINRREILITWYYNDGTQGSTKNITKYFTREEAISAGEQRRRNVISSLKINTVGLIMMTLRINQSQAQTLGLSFIEEHNAAIFKYIEGAETPLKNIILSDNTHLWLNNIIPNTGGITVRMHLYNAINIDYTINNINT